MENKGVLYEASPYVVRLGVGGDAASPVNCYEIYNTETGVVEDVQKILPNAIHQAMLFSAKLGELESQDSIEWKVKGEE